MNMAIRRTTTALVSAGAGDVLQLQWRWPGFAESLSLGGS